MPVRLVRLALTSLTGMNWHELMKLGICQYLLHYKYTYFICALKDVSLTSVHQHIHINQRAITSEAFHCVILWFFTRNMEDGDSDITVSWSTSAHHCSKVSKDKISGGG